MTVPLIGQRPVRILMGTVAGDHMMTRTAALCQITYERLRALGFQVAWKPIESSYGGQCKNELVQDVIDSKSDVLFTIDSDQTFAITVPERLYRRLGVGRDIVGCDYRCRTPPHNMNARKLDGTRCTGEETGMEEVDFLPGGFMMIRRQVLLSMSYPWFWIDYGKKPSDLVGDDANFARAARAKGFKIWVDHDLSNEVYHRVPTDLCRKWHE
jgi:hypothetical protein